MPNVCCSSAKERWWTLGCFVFVISHNETFMKTHGLTVKNSDPITYTFCLAQTLFCVIVPKSWKQSTSSNYYAAKALSHIPYMCRF